MFAKGRRGQYERKSSVSLPTVDETIEHPLSPALSFPLGHDIQNKFEDADIEREGAARKDTFSLYAPSKHTNIFTQRVISYICMTNGKTDPQAYQKLRKYETGKKVRGDL